MTTSTLVKNNNSLKIAVSYKTQPNDIVRELAEQLGTGPFAFLLIYFSPQFFDESLALDLVSHFPATPLYGCSTAGELTLDGISEGSVMVLGFPEDDFSVKSVYFPELNDFSIRDGQTKVKAASQQFQAMRSAEKPHSFALMMVDGLSYREEQLVSAINLGLRDIPLVGGSAGDGLNFKETFIINEGQVCKNSAVLLLIESRFPVCIFKCDSFIPTDVKFVVTKADAENRIVYELNAMPAAAAYAQALGLQEDDLDLLCFASHPLCVCFGGSCYVRSIQDLLEDGALRFYCAIDEGIVFTLAEIDDMVLGIEKTMEAIQRDIGEPQLIIGFDCILRRMISDVNQSRGQINQLFKDNNVVGFNTYGEQVHAMHHNLTFSGIAIGQ